MRPIAGFSLIELMIAMALGVVLVLGVTTVVVNSSRSYGELTKTSQQLENGRYAIEVLNDDLRHAGFYGLFSQPFGVATALVDPCATDVATLNSGLPLAVQGYDQDDDTSSKPKPSCISSFVGNDTDVLVVRRASTQTTASGALDAAKFYLESSADTGQVILGSTGATLSDVREFQVHVYFIRPYSRTAGDGIPTLCRWALEQAGVECLVEGIENLQVDYGIDTNTDGMPDSYTPVPANATDWEDVVTVQVNLLARNVELTAGKRPEKKTYQLGSEGPIEFNAGDNECSSSGGECYFKRRVFSSTIRLTNVSGRREAGGLR